MHKVSASNSEESSLWPGPSAASLRGSNLNLDVARENSLDVNKPASQGDSLLRCYPEERCHQVSWFSQSQEERPSVQKCESL